MTSYCVQGGRGGQKRPKTCVRTKSMLPQKLELLVLPGIASYLWGSRRSSSNSGCISGRILRKTWKRWRKCFKQHWTNLQKLVVKSRFLWYQSMAPCRLFQRTYKKVYDGQKVGGETFADNKKYYSVQFFFLAAPWDPQKMTINIDNW